MWLNWYGIERQPVEMEDPSVITVGVISDTHGLLRPPAIEHLNGVKHIIHAGDIGKREVLDALQALAPVTAVRGNMDGIGWSKDIPETKAVELGEAWIYVLHDLDRLDLDPEAAGFHAVIFGHSHRPFAEWKGGVLYLNPGSAGPNRFRRPVSLAILHIEGKDLRYRFMDLAG